MFQTWSAEGNTTPEGRGAGAAGLTGHAPDEPITSPPRLLVSQLSSTIAAFGFLAATGMPPETGKLGSPSAGKMMRTGAPWALCVTKGGEPSATMLTSPRTMSVTAGATPG